MSTSLPPITVPQASPGAGYRALRAEIDGAVARALESGWYVLGQELRAFEAEFAAWLGVTASVGCGNGTDAIALALRALDIGPGSTVVTVSHTAVATVAAIEMVGATSLLIDIDPLYYTMDPAELASVLERPPPGLPPIRAVLPVHLYGQAADLVSISASCTRHGVALIEDCAQAHGARLAPWAMAVPFRPTMPVWRPESPRCGNTAGEHTISAMRSALTAASTSCRPPSYGSSLAIWMTATQDGARSPACTTRRWPGPGSPRRPVGRTRSTCSIST